MIGVEDVEPLDREIRQFFLREEALRDDRECQQLRTELDERISSLQGEQEVVIAGVGLVNSGKSMVTNATYGEGQYLFPSDDLPATASVVTIQSHAHPFAVLTTEENPEIADGQVGEEAIRATITQVNNQLRSQLQDYFIRRDRGEKLPEEESPQLPLLHIHSPISWFEHFPAGIRVKALDSPGANESHVASIRTRVHQLLMEADIILYVLDGTQLGSTDERQLLMDLATQSPQLLRRIGTRGLFIVNKADRMPSQDLQRVRHYVQEFLQRVFQGHAAEHREGEGREGEESAPLVVPEERILLLSGLHGFLAQQVKYHDRMGGWQRMPERERALLLRVLYGRRVPALEDIDRQDLLERVEPLWQESGIPQLQQQLQTFLEREAVPLMLESRVARLMHLMTRGCATLARKQHVLTLSAEEGQQRVQAMQRVLEEASQSADLDTTMFQFAQLSRLLTGRIDRWVTRSMERTEPFTSSPTTQILPTPEAATAEAQRLAAQLQAEWLRQVIPEQTTLVQEIQRELQASQRVVLEPFVQHCDALLAILYSPEERVAHQGDVDLIRQGLEQQCTQVRLPPLSLGPANHYQVAQAIRRNLRQESYTHQEPTMVTEHYTATQVVTQHHSRRRFLRGTKHWTTQHTIQVPATRQVLVYKPVQRTRQVEENVLTHAAVGALVAQACQPLLDGVRAALLASVHEAIHVREDQVERAFDTLQQFVATLQEDLCSQSLSQQAQRTLALTCQQAHTRLQDYHARLTQVHQRLLHPEMGVVAPAPPPPDPVSPATLEAIRQHFLSQRLWENGRGAPSEEREEVERSCLWYRLRALVEQARWQALCADDEESLFEWETLESLLRSYQVRVGLVGLAKTGKSTTTNALLQCFLVPTHVLPETAQSVVYEHLPFTSVRCENQSYDLPLLINRDLAPDWGGLQDANPDILTLGQLLPAYAPSIQAQGTHAVREQLSESNARVRAQADDLGTGQRNHVVVAPLPMMAYAAGGAWSTMPVSITDTPGPNEAFLARQQVQTSLGQVQQDDVLVYLLDASRMFQEDEDQALSHIHEWLHRILAARSEEQMAHPLPLLVVVNKVDLVVRSSTSATLDSVRHKAYQWLMHQLEAVLRVHPRWEGQCSPYSLLPMERLVFWSARLAWYGLSLRRGEWSEEAVRGLLELQWGRQPPGSWEQVVPLFPQAVDLACQESQAEGLYESIMDLILQEALPSLLAWMPRLRQALEGLAERHASDGLDLLRVECDTLHSQLASHHQDH